MKENKLPTLTPQEIRDEELISAAFQKLIDTYLATNHRRKVDIITKAFNFAKQAHKGVRRLSGEPYILHPIAVAQIVCEEIGLGSTSICAALLHDVEEDTEYTNEDIANLFGAKVANIVEGLTKISGGIFGDKASLQAETFKKLLRQADFVFAEAHFGFYGFDLHVHNRFWRIGFILQHKPCILYRNTDKCKQFNKTQFFNGCVIIEPFPSSGGFFDGGSDNILFVIIPERALCDTR